MNSEADRTIYQIMQHDKLSQTQPVQSFAPVIAPHCQVLVLGSVPGQASLNAGQYYAHPRNLFWPIIGEVCGVELSSNYRQRLQQLINTGVGLWDVLAACIRSGSLDSAIDRQSEIANPIAQLLNQHAEIAVVALNGGKAAQLFDRHIFASIDDRKRQQLQILRLPSTSPANASQSLQFKKQAWLSLREYVCA